MATPEILGIYGGTFSPPHLGHKLAAETFLEKIRPDRLLIIPTFLPPHKKISGADAPEHRLAMCRLCFKDLPRTEVSDMEIKRTGKSYTFDTVSALSKENREICFLCGTDMLLTLDTWYRAPELFSLCTFVLERREQDPALDRSIDERIAFYRKEYGARIVEIDIEPIEISSTNVRNAVHRHAPSEVLSSMVTEEVARYINEHRLYLD
ncbi:MAG: nicotinate (nicotinamide) nucleotide adenylyltransferase [Clostridia bacterium]|nr:nicotinate (nicotinamide) nucleotide adenylyltransferase [Clostridia bacterium]